MKKQGNINYIYANQNARNIVRDVKMHFIDGFQHAAIDVKIEMSIQKGPADALVTPQTLPDIDQLRGIDCDEFIYWAEAKWEDEYEEAHARACRNQDTEAWQLCEVFDSECLKRRLLLQGIDGSSLGDGRGQVPRREPRKYVTRKFGQKNYKELESCNTWLKKVIRTGREAQ